MEAIPTVAVIDSARPKVPTPRKIQHPAKEQVAQRSAAESHGKRHGNHAQGVHAGGASLQDPVGGGGNHGDELDGLKHGWPRCLHSNRSRSLVHPEFA